MTQDDLKKSVAKAALSHIPYDGVVGVGSGTTVNFFIEELAAIKGKIEGVVASSEETERRLKAHHIPICDLNSVRELSVYIDGADEVDPYLNLIKGGGGALTREKIIAAVAKQFICIVDETKQVDILGKFPLAIEVIPMARSYVAREMVKLKGDPVYRQGFKTDNGNVILDVYNLNILNPKALESELNQIVGVVSNGLFAARKADKLLISTLEGVQER